MDKHARTKGAPIPESNDPRYFICQGSTGKLWVEHESGEGGDFPADEVRKAVRENRLDAYYQENF